MAYVLVNKDGTSNAKVGDYVVTGGGVYQKTESGSVKVDSLPTPTGKTTDYSVVQSVYNQIVNATGQKSSQSNTPQKTTSGGGELIPVITPKAVDVNGIVSVDSYDPYDYGYADDYYSRAPTGIGKVIGYAVLGLIGLVVLDRVMMGGR